MVEFRTSVRIADSEEQLDVTVVHVVDSAEEPQTHASQQRKIRATVVDETEESGAVCAVDRSRAHDVGEFPSVAAGADDHDLGSKNRLMRARAPFREAHDASPTVSEETNGSVRE